MKAIVYHEYGSPDVVRCEEIEKPVAEEDQVLIRVRAASVNPLDWRLMRGSPAIGRLLFGFGLMRPKNPRLGVDVAGVVEAVGRSVTKFKPGDEVFGGCRGAFAEYVCAREKRVIAKPDNITFEQAASAPVAAFTALQGLRDKGGLQPGQKVLINGAAGGVGTFAVQIAKSFGAEVTGVCSTGNVDMVRSLGADHVIDYTQGDFTKSAQRYDIIIDNVVNHSLSACRRVLNPEGIHVVVGAPHGRGMIGFLVRVMVAGALSRFRRQKVGMFMAEQNQDDLAVMSELMATGKVKPVIDRCYPLSETSAALGYVEEGHARGKVVITVD